MKCGYPEAVVKVFINIDKGEGSRRADVVLVLREDVKSSAVNCPNTCDQDCRSGVLKSCPGLAA